MLRCKNKTFNKFLFFSFVFFIISLFINTMIVSNAANDQEKIMIKKNSLRDDTSNIQMQQRQIIKQLESVERKLWVAQLIYKH